MDFLIITIRKKMGVKMKKAAIYVRVSTKDKGQDVNNQVVQLQEYCQRRGFEIYQIYQDNESGSKGRKERSGFDQLFKDASRHKFDIVLFWALDRFSRQGIAMTMSYLSLLDSYGVRFISYTEEFLSTDNELVSKILITVFSYFAELERKKIAERTKAGLEKAKRNGKQIGRQGLSNKDVDRMNQLFNEGLSNSAVARELNLHRSTVLKYKKQQKAA